MARLLKVEGHESLVRDTSSNAVINNSTKDYESFMRQKELFVSRKLEIQEQANEINNLKDELSEIKSLLKQLLEK